MGGITLPVGLAILGAAICFDIYSNDKGRKEFYQQALFKMADADRGGVLSTDEKAKMYSFLSQISAENVLPTEWFKDYMPTQ